MPNECNMTPLPIATASQGEKAINGQIDAN